jgi:hypothetical protein
LHHYKEQPVRVTEWEKLVDTKKDSLRRGALIKFPASHPFEGMVVMMVWQEFGKALPMGLITITGYKAGINPYVTFPVEVCERRYAAVHTLQLAS